MSVAVLVTRPALDNERTAQALRERGYDALLAPVLKAEQLPFTLGDIDNIGGIVVTSANALRAIADHPMLFGLRTKPLFAVGERTATEAKAVQFGDVRVADGNAAALLKLIGAQRPEHIQTLLYLAGEEVSRDIASELAMKGIVVIPITTYRMVRVMHWPEHVVQAIRQGGIESVLHYSKRSALCFAELARAHDVGTAALAVPQCCLSQNVADVLRESGACLITVADLPNEQSLLEALDRALARVQGSERRC